MGVVPRRVDQHFYLKKPWCRLFSLCKISHDLSLPSPLHGHQSHNEPCPKSRDTEAATNSQATLSESSCTSASKLINDKRTPDFTSVCRASCLSNTHGTRCQPGSKNLCGQAPPRYHNAWEYAMGSARAERGWERERNKSLKRETEDELKICEQYARAEKEKRQIESERERKGEQRKERKHTRTTMQINANETWRLLGHWQDKKLFHIPVRISMGFASLICIVKDMRVKIMHNFPTRSSVTILEENVNN